MKTHYIIFFLFILGGCISKKQLYDDRLLDNGNRHLYINNHFDFSISYFDVISVKNRQTDSIDFKKTHIPIAFQKHLKKTIKRPSELLFQAHRTSMSNEDIIAVLYTNKGDFQVFSNKIVQKIQKIIPKDSIQFQPYQTLTGYWLNTEAFKENKKIGSDFMQNRPFNMLRYKAFLDKNLYKFHEFHVPFNDKHILRLIWIADVKRTIQGPQLNWEKVDEQNHYLELFSLNDSAKYEIGEIIPNNFFKIAQDAFRENGYLGAVKSLQRYEDAVRKKDSMVQVSTFYQCLMTYQSFLGDNKGSLTSLDISFPKKPKVVDDTYFEGSEAHDAADFILKKAENQRVVMFNEAHNCGQNRAFMRDILRGLYEKGFRHLALETLNSADSINERGYPLRQKSGFYTDEPTFGQMLREAKNIGFQLHGYENETPCEQGADRIQCREIGQANNLKKIVDKYPNEKIVVWAGHSHIHESDKTKWMAYHFKQITGIDPLTIEQTALRETSTDKNDPGTWKAALKKWEYKKPIIVTAKDSVFVVTSHVGSVDMQVFFPRTDYTNDYPHWMGNSDTHFYELNLEKSYFQGKLLMIFLKKEYSEHIDKAVPVMNIPLSRIGNFKLFLKPDHYTAVIRDDTNWEYFYKEFEVK